MAKWVVRRKGESGGDLGLKFQPVRKVYEIVAIAEATHMNSKVEALQRFQDNEIDPEWFEVGEL